MIFFRIFDALDMYTYLANNLLIRNACFAIPLYIKSF